MKFQQWDGKKWNVDHRLDHLRPVDRAADDRSIGGAVRQGEEHHAARLQDGRLSASQVTERTRGNARDPSPFSFRLPRLPFPLSPNAMSAIPKPESQAAAYLTVSNIEVIYDHVILVLKGVSLQVQKGTIVALLGANGAGKTTTLKAISNLLRAERGEVTKGSIEFDGQRSRPAHAERAGAHGRLPGDGGPPLLPAPDGRGEPAHRRVHAARSAGPSSPATSISSTSTSRGCASGAARSPATPPAASSR